MQAFLLSFLPRKWSLINLIPWADCLIQIMHNLVLLYIWSWSWILFILVSILSRHKSFENLFTRNWDIALRRLFPGHPQNIDVWGLSILMHIDITLVFYVVTIYKCYRSLSCSEEFSKKLFLPCGPIRLSLKKQNNNQLRCVDFLCSFRLVRNLLSRLLPHLASRYNSAQLVKSILKILKAWWEKCIIFLSSILIHLHFLQSFPRVSTIIVPRVLKISSWPLNLNIMWEWHGNGWNPSTPYPTTTNF